MNGPVNAYLYDSMFDDDFYKIDIACYNDVDGDATLECRAWVKIKSCAGNSNKVTFGWGINEDGDNRYDYAGFVVDFNDPNFHT